jgi:hypothetical protein
MNRLISSLYFASILSKSINLLFIKIQLLKLNTFKLFSLLILSFLWSCDDGNIITTTFDFDENTNLSLCQDDNVNVLYFIDQDTNEAISFEFTLADFDGTFIGENDELSNIVEIPINLTNRVFYRRLSSDISGANYYCQQIPPSIPQVLEEFVSTTGGTATLSINISDQDDDDDVPAELEDIDGDGDLFNDDTDGDGIPNFLDVDDDNDNVITRLERLEIEDENGNIIPGVYTDTDGDDILNYLDNDDDGDGVLTINEDLDVCFDPENPVLNPDNDTNADDLPNYLNDQETESVDINVVKRNEISRTFFTRVVFSNITFQNQNNSETLTYTTFEMGRFTVSAQQNLPFDDGIISIDDVENICQ